MATQFYRSLCSWIVSQVLKDVLGPCLDTAAFIFTCFKYSMCDLEVFPEIGEILLIFGQLSLERAISSVNTPC